MAFLIRQLDEHSLGSSLRSLRKRQGFSLNTISKQTQVQQAHLVAFETDSYQDLPDPRYARQLLKIYVEALNGDPAYFVARFDDECGACSTDIQSLKAPRTRIRQRLIRSWRTIASRLLIGLMAAGLLFYVGIQIHQLLSPPALLVDTPHTDVQTTSASLEVTGQTEQEVLVRVNDKPVLTDPTGRFATRITLTRGLNLITIEARRKYGKPEVVHRSVFLEDVRGTEPILEPFGPAIPTTTP